MMAGEERYIRDPAVIAAILDLCEVVHVGFQGGEGAYVVPMIYGYGVTEDKLRIFLHSPREGRKLKLLKANPRVCCSFSAWRNFPEHPRQGHIHDFRSVIAFGTMRQLDPKTESQTCKQALLSIFRKTRSTTCRNHGGARAIHLYVIECSWEDVTGKSEFPLRGPEDVPFPED